MSEKTYGVGIVGFGFMGKTHSYGYRTLPFYYSPMPIRTSLKGVCVHRAQTIDEAIAVGGFEFGTTDYRKLLERDDIHIIHICTPNVLHKDQIIQALQAGKHIYCDKPLAMSHAECREINQAVEKYGKGLVNQVALQYRFYPCTMRAKQLIEEGFLGEIWSFRACYLHASSINRDKPMSWKLDKTQGGGGVLFDLGSHVIDLVGHLIGPFQSLIAECGTMVKERKRADTGERVKVETDDVAMLIARTPGGGVGTIEASKIATGANDELRVEIHGDKAAIRFNLMDPNWLEVYDVRDAAEPIGGMRGFKKIETVSRYPSPGGKFPAPACNIGWLRSHVACLYNFIAAVGGQAKAHPTFAESAELQRLMESAYQSAEQRRWVSL